MSKKKHFTEYICVCQQCDQETMIVEECGELAVACPKCHRSLKVKRPDGELTTTVLDRLLHGQFITYNRLTSKDLKD